MKLSDKDLKFIVGKYIEEIMNLYPEDIRHEFIEYAQHPKIFGVNYRSTVHNINGNVSSFASFISGDKIKKYFRERNLEKIERSYDTK